MHGFDSTRDFISQGIVAAILVTVFALLAADRVHRVLIPIGAVAVIWLISYFTPFRLISFDTAKEAVDLNVILLLFSMMALVGVLKTTNVFPWAVDRLLERSRGNPSRAAKLIIWFTGVLSAVLDNVTTVIFTYPMASEMARRLKINASAFLLPMVMAANIGGTATLIGDPPNILIGSQVGLDFNAFVIHLTPVIVVVMAAQAVMIHVLWGKEMKATPEREARVMAMKPEDAIKDWLLLKQSLVVLIVVMIAFALARPLHLEPATIAMFGAAVLMLLDNWAHLSEKASHNIHQTFGDVEWITIFFFIGLFIVVHGVEVGGLLKLLADKLVVATGGDMANAGYAILWASAFLSAIVDNIPFVATMIPLIKSMAPAYGGADKIEPLWWCLSLGACLGGNGTLIGASANLTVAGIAERNGVPFRFLTYAYYAMPMMVVSVAICHVYVWWRYF
ncbi:MAG: sodium:proton antiporter [Xanthobacteraceae bacterium]